MKTCAGKGPKTHLAPGTGYLAWDSGEARNASRRIGMRLRRTIGNEKPRGIAVFLTAREGRTRGSGADGDVRPTIFEGASTRQTRVSAPRGGAA